MSRLSRHLLRSLNVVVLSFVTSLSAAEPVVLWGRAMGTMWTVKYFPPSSETTLARASADKLSREITSCLEGLEQEFSTYRPNSVVSHFNASKSTEWIAVPPDLAFVALESRRISQLTGGAFDATVAPLVYLWGFGPAPRISSVPTEVAIAATRARVGYRSLEIRRDPAGAAFRKIRPDLAVDFSSMAKGYAADSISRLLHSSGLDDHFIQVGGDTVASGHPPDATAWRVGIENPITPPASVSLASSVERVIPLAGQALSTSGDRRNSVLIGGQRYGHIMDPRSGRPAASALASVSVVAESCARSSALATALFVLGPEEGLPLARREGIPALFLVVEGGALVAHTSANFPHPAMAPHP